MPEYRRRQPSIAYRPGMATTDGTYVRYMRSLTVAATSDAASLCYAHGLEPDVQERLNFHRLDLSPQESHDFGVARRLRPGSMVSQRHADEINATTTAKPVGFAEIVAKVKPAVIAVTVRLESGAQMESEEPDTPSQSQPFSENSPLHRHFFGSPERQPSPARQIKMALGSGFFVSSDGYAVTNDHVVQHGVSFAIATEDGTTYTAKVVGADLRTDLALLKVDGRNDFPCSICQSRATDRRWIIAVGNPYGLGGTVTAGIVSALGRRLDTDTYDDFIQIDAPINKGNSGGPSFDIDGNVIGVNTAIFSPSGGSVGIGFAIPATTVGPVIQQLKEKGVVTRAALGVEVQPVTPDIAQASWLEEGRGSFGGRSPSLVAPPRRPALFQVMSFSPSMVARSQAARSLLPRLVRWHRGQPSRSLSFATAANELFR